MVIDYIGVCIAPLIEELLYSHSTIKDRIGRRHGNRVYEYEYTLAKWIGKRIAKSYKKTGRTVFIIKTERPLFWGMQHNVKASAMDSLEYGFKLEMCGRTYEGWDNNSIHYSQSVSGTYGNLIFSNIYIAVLPGKNSGRHMSARRLVLDACEIDLITREMEQI